MDLEDIVENLEHRHPGERDKTLNLVAEGVIQLAEGGGGGAPYKMSFDTWGYSPDRSYNVSGSPGATSVYWGWKEFSAIKWRDEDPYWVGAGTYSIVFGTIFSFIAESHGETTVSFQIPYDTYTNAETPPGIISNNPVPLPVVAMDVDSVTLPAQAFYYRTYDDTTSTYMVTLVVKVDAATADREVTVSINTQLVTMPQIP